MKKNLLFIFIFLILLPVKVFAADWVEINTASLAQLDTLTGIGPVYAQRIIDGRPYSSVDDLDRVKGIGSATLQKIKDQGLAYVSASSLRGASEASNEAIPTEEIASSAAPPRNDAPATYPSGIFINEILPNPEGADETEEWIELYNSNNFDVDLAGWQIQDIAGTTTTFTIPKNTMISANGFIVFKRPETKIMLNNDEDGLSLSTPDKKIVDSTNFTKAPLDQSYNKTGSGWAWSPILTPGSKNIVAAVVTKTPSTSSGPNGLPKIQNSDKNNTVELALADISQITIANPWFLFFIVLAVAVIFAAVVLFIRLRFKNYKNLKI